MEFPKYGAYNRNAVSSMAMTMAPVSVAVPIHKNAAPRPGRRMPGPSRPVPASRFPILVSGEEDAVVATAHCIVHRPSHRQPNNRQQKQPAAEGAQLIFV